MVRQIGCGLFIVLAASLVCPAGEVLQYWQVTVDANGWASAPEKLPPVQADALPSKDHPVTVPVKPSPTAKEYRILRVPTHAPAAPTVEVVHKGKDTLYYWIVAHEGLLRSPIAGPAIAKDCNAAELCNIVRWTKTEPYTEYTILRTRTPEVPSGEMQVLRAWGVPADKATEFTDRNGAALLTDYPCYPQGTGAGSRPIGTGPFLVGVSKGPAAFDANRPHDANVVNAAVTDTGALQKLFVPPTRSVSELALAPKREQGLREIAALNPGNNGAVNLDIVNNQPKGVYDFGGPMGLFISERDVAGGHNDYSIYGGGPRMKSFHIPFRVDQYNYTAGQMATLVMFTGKYGEGDNVLFTTHTSTAGLTEDGGDEGTEIFMASSNRDLTTADYELTADAPQHATSLAAKRVGAGGQIGTGRPVVNLTQAVRQGSIVRIDDDMRSDANLRDSAGAWNRVTRLTGEGTAFTPEMEGWYLSLDCDTRADGIRQWYRIVRVNSPTSLDIFAYTFFSASTYLGHARNVEYHGKEYRGCIKHEPRPDPDPNAAKAGGEAFTLAPATTVGEYTDKALGLTVLPLKQQWNKGDKVQVVAGPQTHLSLGKLGVGGKLMPQDFVSGLWIHNDCDRLSNDPAFYVMGAWNTTMKIEFDSRGLSNGIEFVGKTNPHGGALVAGPDTNLLRIKDVPVVLAGLSADGGEIVFAKDRHDGPKVLAIGEKSVSLGEGVSLKGGNMLRGQAKLSGDAKAVTFAVKFPQPHAAAPYVVASSNLPIGMGVSDVTPEGFKVTFASPPPAGQENVLVTWMVME